MIHVKDLNEAFDHQISGGSDFCWSCWPNARYIEYQSKYAYVSAVFNTETRQVYEVTVTVDVDTWDPDVRPYRWMNPEFVGAYNEEAKTREVDPSQAWDDVKWYDLDVSTDFLEKAIAIFNGDDSFDKRILTELELPEDMILEIALMAHKRDITMNKMVQEIIELAIKELPVKV